MCKTMTTNALRLKEFINQMDDFKFVKPEYCPYIDHIGALFTDTILQAGLNYRSVVWPRVAHVLETFPYATTVSVFAEVLDNYGTANVLHWRNADKIQRMNELVWFCIDNRIETSRQLTDFLKYDNNILLLKDIHGIGNKTCDYLKRLLGFDTVAVDRHIRSFMESADIFCDDYFDIKEIVEFAADFMEKPRRVLDYSIWSYMSRKEQKFVQLTFEL